MIPIHELLNRIRWDPEFAKGEFQLGYYDRAENRIILVPLKEVTFPPNSPETHMVELHKELGQTQVKGQNLLDRPQWRWVE